MKASKERNRREGKKVYAKGNFSPSEAWNGREGIPVCDLKGFHR